MRRDYFTLATRTPAGHSDGPDRPAIVVDYDGPREALTAALTDDAGERLPADALDVTCRLQHDDGAEDRSCVLALTHRLTGEFFLEVNGDAEDVLVLVDAARSADEDASYRVRVEPEDGEPFTVDKDTLLVYDEEGSLLRHHSLIPGGVEL